MLSTSTWVTAKLLAANVAQPAAAIGDGTILQILGSSMVRAPWGWALLASFLVALWRGWPAIKARNNEREVNLLASRGEDMEAMRARLDGLESKLATKDAELSVVRHELANMKQCFDSLVLLIETAPEKAPEHIEKIKAMRRSQDAEMSAEKGAIRGAAMRAASDREKGE